MTARSLSTGYFPANHHAVEDFVRDAVSRRDRVEDAKFLTDRQIESSRPIDHPRHDDAGGIATLDGDNIAVEQFRGGQFGSAGCRQRNLAPVGREIEFFRLSSRVAFLRPSAGRYDARRRRSRRGQRVAALNDNLVAGFPRQSAGRRQRRNKIAAFSRECVNAGAADRSVDDHPVLPGFFQRDLHERLFGDTPSR